VAEQRVHIEGVCTVLNAVIHNARFRQFRNKNLDIQLLKSKSQKILQEKKRKLFTKCDAYAK